VKKYLHVAHVVYRDALEILVPRWLQAYAEGQAAELALQAATVKATALEQAQAGVAALVVTESAPAEP
jgi:hypothetical protein